MPFRENQFCEYFAKFEVSIYLFGCKVILSSSYWSREISIVWRVYPENIRTPCSLHSGGFTQKISGHPVAFILEGSSRKYQDTLQPSFWRVHPENIRTPCSLYSGGFTQKISGHPVAFILKGSSRKYQDTLQPLF